MAYTDLLNEAIDDVAATLTAVSGLRVVTDPTKLVPTQIYMFVYCPCLRSSKPMSYLGAKENTEKPMVE